ncbi:MAG TPA: hypothetical protein VGI20_01185 [Rhizomicrobium sp.]
MTKPSIGDLLAGVASSLREAVLPEIPAGPTRRQIQVAISIIRRASRAWDRVGPYLYADNKDIEETLRHVSALLDRAKSDDAGLKLLGQKMLTALDQRSGAEVEYPSPAALSARNVELQGLLVELQQALHAPPARDLAERTEVLGMLRAVFRRMLVRELEVNVAEPARK